MIIILGGKGMKYDIQCVYICQIRKNKNIKTIYGSQINQQKRKWTCD